AGISGRDALARGRGRRRPVGALDRTIDHGRESQSGNSLAELLVSLAVSSLLLLGVFGSAQSMRQSARAADSLHSLEEKARFAMDLLRADIRSAGFWGLNSDAGALRVAAGASVRCGGTDASDWAFRFEDYVAAADAWPLPCSPYRNRRQPGTDVLEIRRAGQATAGVDSRRLQVHSSRLEGIVFSAGSPPSLDGETEIRDLVVHAWYVSARSSHDSGEPSLRRKTLVRGGLLRDEEILAGVEDFQVRLALDSNRDGAADRVVDPAAPAPSGARIVAVRFWLLLRHDNPETGHVDGRSYAYGDRAARSFDDARRRLLVSASEVVANARQD
ncbi:MAG: PilW family protein, partial [Gammaproteobacteria bacterium]|nr:PilW family protein [Gammaproteobacteria bacterium]